MKRPKKQNNPDPIPDAIPRQHLVVGIGASAGGIHALKAFFSNVPKNSGNVYVVILHLSPDYESHLAEVIQTAAAIPVKQIGEGQTKVEPDCVYVIPPNRSLRVNDGHIETTAVADAERRAPIDLFFRTLAESHKNHAVSVILTGTGSDGSMGIKRVKEMGGIVVAQEPKEAEYADMPRHSIATGLVDYVLPIGEMPRQINEYKSRLGKTDIPEEPEERPDDVNEKALVEIFVLLRTRTGHDFTNYKRATVLRRIERRMNVNGRQSLKEYVAFLRENPPEAQALLKDLLISVTNFFRDAEPFSELEHELVPKILEDNGSKDAVRAWVAGCATGEEAYSIAMVFAEQMLERFEIPQVQIFATDIDEAAIAHARAGLYTEADVADVSPERLRQFFQKEGENYRVRREIREMVLFAVHNVTKDPPFSRLDLATCRNLLIYLNRTAQTRVMETMHFALKPAGYLFLGSSESAETDDNLFVAFNKESRIYQSRPVVTRLAVPVPDLSPALLNQQFRGPARRHQTEEIRALERLSYTALHQHLLEAYAPPSIVVNGDHEIVHLSERAGRFLQITGGEPSKNLLVVARPELRLELRTALYQAVQRASYVTVPAIRVKTEDGLEVINIIVRPVTDNQDPNRGFILVIFESASDKQEAEARPLIADEPLARQLEGELVHTKSQLRSTIEQYEVQHEELKASNEELQAINEELRSAAEEIETSKEELQSVNEELSTVNQELKIKIEELSQSNNDFQNLINSTSVGTIFLDRRLRVKLFTQSATEVFNLIPGDVGRPLSDLSSRLLYADLVADAQHVLRDLQPLERGVQAAGGEHYMLRILPYRTGEDRIDGVVITFIDISSRKKVEEQLLRSQERLSNALNAETVGVIFFDNDVRFTDCNDTFLKMTGYEREDLVGRRVSWEKLTPTEWRERSHEAIAELRATGHVAPYEKEYFRKDGSRFFGLFTGARLNNDEIVEYVVDISSLKHAEKNLSFQSMLLDTVEQSIIATDLDGNVIYWNKFAEKLFGWNSDEVNGRNVLVLTTPGASTDRAGDIMARLRKGESWSGEFVVKRRDDSTFLAQIYNSPVFDSKGKVVGIVGVSIDISRRRETEDALRESDERLRMLVESATDYAIFTVTKNNLIDTWSPGAEATFGFNDKEIIGRSGELLFTSEDRAAGVPEKEMKCALETGKAEYERWHLRRDGSHFYASGVIQPLTDGSRGFVKICRDETARIKTETALRDKDLLQQLVTTQEDERRRMARDLHDHLGQQMTSLRLRLSSLLEACDEEELCEQIETIQKTAEQIDRDVDFLAWEIRPASLDDLGLRVTLGNFVREWERHTGIKAEFHATGLARARLPFEVETNLYRIGQEALNNIYKHARAKSVSVLLEKRGGNVSLIVEDDGVGFEPASAKVMRRGLGLAGMRERAAIIGGALEIESAKGKGTTVYARVPKK